MSIGNNIRNIRKEKGMTLQQIADIIGCSPQLISQYESGKRQPKLETKKKIADALGCEVSDIDESIIVVPLPKYELTPERLERFKKDAEAEKLIDKKASGENITADDQKKISDYTKRMLNTLNGTENLEYDNSYSYASSAEELDKFQDAKQIELEKKRAKPFKLYEAEDDGPPKPFTRPLQSSYDKPNEDYQDNSLKLHTNTRGIDWEQLDDFRFDELMLKLDRGEELTPAEINFKSAYLERCLKKVGYIFAKFYSMLNAEGQKKADEQIDRAIEQVELLTKIPEYQKKPTTPPQE